MSSPIKVTYTRTWENKPLVQIDGGPFCDVERTPDQLRTMAAMLLKVADAGEARSTTGRHWVPGRVLLNADGEPCRNSDGFLVDAPIIGGDCVPAARRPAPAPAPATCAARPHEADPTAKGRVERCAMLQTAGVRQ